MKQAAYSLTHAARLEGLTNIKLTPLQRQIINDYIRGRINDAEVEAIERVVHDICDELDSCGETKAASLIRGGFVLEGEP